MQAIKPEILPEILILIGEIDEFKGGWRAYQNLAPERLEALRRVATVESVASSTRIDPVSTKLSYEATDRYGNQLFSVPLTTELQVTDFIGGKMGISSGVFRTPLQEPRLACQKITILLLTVN